MQKQMKTMKKNEKNAKNSRKIAIFHFLGNCNFPRVVFLFFFIFFIICFLSFFIIFDHFSSIPPLEVKMIKTHDKKMKKNSKKIAIFYFSENFCTTGRKNDKKLKKK